MTNAKGNGNPAQPDVKPDPPENALSRPRGKPRARLNRDEKANLYQRQLDAQFEAARKSAARKKGQGLVRLSAWVPQDIKSAVLEMINDATRLHTAAHAAAAPRTPLSPFTQRLREATAALKFEVEMDADSSESNGENTARRDPLAEDMTVDEVDVSHHPDVFDDEEMLTTFEIDNLPTNDR